MKNQTKSRYNSFDEFWPDFNAAMKAAIEKKKPAGVGTLLGRQAGFVPHPDQVRQVYQTVVQLPNSDSLEFSILVMARTRRLPSRIITGLADEIWGKYRAVAEFPDTEHPTWIDVRDWICGRISRAMSAGQELALVGRAMFAALLSVRERDFYTNAVLLLADELAGASGKKSELDRNEIEAIVSELLTKRIPSRKELCLVGRTGKAMRSEMQASIEQRRQALGRAEALQSEITNLKTESASKDQQIRDHAAAIEAIRAELASVTEKLALAQEQITATEEHWNLVLKQKLSGLVAKLRSDIQHETREIAMCLDRNSPNVTMALERARQIDKILEEVNSTK